MVLLHQVANSSRMWERLISNLDGSVSVVAFDLPGHGGSEPFTAKPEIEDYARVVAQALDALEIERSSLGGFHTGAGFATYIATNEPERVESLVLLGMPHFDAKFRSHMRTTLPRDWHIPAREDGRHLTEMWGQSSSPDYEVRTRELADRLIAGANGWWSADALFGIDFEPLLVSVACPVLLIHSHKDFLVKTQPGVEALIADCRRVELTGEVLIADDRPQTTGQETSHERSSPS